MSIQLLKVKQVAEMLSIGYDSALALIHSKELPTVPLPGRRSYLVDLADVRRFIERLKVGSEDGSNDESEPPKTPENAVVPGKDPKRGNGYERGWNQRIKRIRKKV